MGRTIEQQLSHAGYALLGTNEINELILSLLEKKNTRYLKAIPFLIYIHKPNLDLIFEKTKEKKLLVEILAITKKIFQEKKISRELPDFKNNKITHDYNEFKQEFALQMHRSAPIKSSIDKEKIYAERNQEFQLSILFTPKEKELLKHLLDEKRFSKTEYEYYSRKTKKKLYAIIQLQELAKALSVISPQKEK
jgi:hypothetical protein